MGFCLLQLCDDHSGLYVAINGFTEFDFYAVNTEYGAPPRCRLEFAAAPSLDVSGDFAAVKTVIDQALTIGVHPCQLHMLGGTKKLKALPLLFKRTEEIVYVREIPPQDLDENRAPDIMTASVMLMTDGSQQKIAERPGIFAMRANEGGVVPGV